MRYTKGQNGGWHEESSLYLKKDGTKECSNGNLDLTQLFVPKRSVGRPKRRWEDDLNEFTKTEEEQDKELYELKNNNNWMNEIKDYQKWKENEERFSKTRRAHFGVEE